MKLPDVVEVSAPATVAVSAVTVTAPATSAIMSTLVPTAKSVLASTVIVIAEALVNKIVLPASLEISVRAVVASVIKVVVFTASRSTFSVTAPEVPPPVSAVPAVTAVMSPGFDTSAHADPS